MQVWKKAFEGKIADVGEASVWIDMIATGAHWPVPLVFAVQLCLEELLSNIIRHGGGEPNIEVALHVESHCVSLTIEDSGKPFDVAAAPARHADQPLAEITPGGLGIGLVKSFASVVEYARIHDHNRVTVKFLRCKRDGTATPARTGDP